MLKKQEIQPLIDCDKTEELCNETLTTTNLSRKKIYLCLGLVVVLSILVLSVFLIMTQMKNDTINKMLDLGQKYLDAGKYEEAILAFNDAIDIDSKQISAYEGKAEVYIATQKYTEAEEVLMEARQIAASGKTNLLLVEVYDNTEKLVESEKLLEETMTLLQLDIEKTTNKSELIDFYDQLINIYQRLGKDLGSVRTLCSQAFKATEHTKYLNFPSLIEQTKPL